MARRDGCASCAGYKHPLASLAISHRRKKDRIVYRSSGLKMSPSTTPVSDERMY